MPNTLVENYYEIDFKKKQKMNKDIKSIESNLKEIIKKNEDAIKGFKKAAQNVKDKDVVYFLEQRAENRDAFLRQLKNASPELELTDGEISGSTIGKAHRIWMDVKTLFSSNNAEVILQEVVKGDKAAVEEYNEVLTETHVPARVKEILREQRDSIQNDIATSKILEAYN